MQVSNQALSLCGTLLFVACKAGATPAATGPATTPIASADTKATPIKEVSAPETIVGVEHMVLRDGQKIALWEKRSEKRSEKRLEGGEDAGNSHVLVLVHGATWSGRPDFDLQIRDYSAMDAFARAGWDVFAIDIQGYGNSDEPAGESWSRTGDAAKDLGAVIDWIEGERGTKSVSLLGWSWGAQISGMYANQHPERVDRLLLMGFKWGQGAPKRKAPTQKYRVNTAEAAASDFIEGCYEADVVEFYVRESLAADPVSPNGVGVDFTKNLPLVDPAALPMPVMLLYGEHELTDWLFDDASAFFKKLQNRGRALVVLEGGGHAVLLEKPHRRWQQTVLAFFER